MRYMKLCFLAIILGLPLVVPAAAQAPQPVPDAERRPGETLTERLDRSDGLIKPPPVDAPMQVAPPPDTSKTPVIEPEDAPEQQSAPGAAGK